MSLSLHLASSSPRRRDILASLGLEFTFGGVAVDERQVDGETADEMVARLATAKAAAATAAGVIVIGADTTVEAGGRVFGKPADEAEAVEILLALSGRTHRVLTAVAVHSPSGRRCAVSETDVRFREIGQDEARRYWQSGEPRDKAGGYAIQGLGGVFVERISGSYSGVVGLPVFETVVLLRAAGLDVLSNYREP